MQERTGILKAGHGKHKRCDLGQLPLLDSCGNHENTGQNTQDDQAWPSQLPSDQNVPSRSYAGEASSRERRQRSSQNFRVLNITEYWVKADYKASLKDGAAILPS
jgi:hypothetical protein